MFLSFKGLKHQFQSNSNRFHETQRLHYRSYATIFKLTAFVLELQIESVNSLPINQQLTHANMYKESLFISGYVSWLAWVVPDK